jgi:hypothetical protein
MHYEIVTGTEREISDRINGAVTLGPIPLVGAFLGGLTVVFSDPADTVTFPGAAGALVTPVAVAAELLGVSGLEVAIRNGGTGGPNNAQQFWISIQRTEGFTIDAAGTANELLGLSTSEDTVSNGADTFAQVVAYTQGATPGQYAMLRARD